MRWSKCDWVALGLAAAQASCTFYTACPTDPGPAPGGGSGGTGTGGSGTQGGGSAGLGPLPEGEWVNVTSNLAHMPSECGNLSYGTAKPDEDLLLLGVAKNGLWASADGGGLWEKLGSDADPELITNRVTALVFDPEHPETYWETGVYNGSGVFKTTDNGQTFSAFPIGHNDYVSVDFSDPNRETLLASGHEQVHKLYLSRDAGVVWTEIGDYIPVEPLVCSFPYIIDFETFLLGCGSYGGGEVGIYRTTNSGGTWTKVSDYGGGSPPLVTQDGTIYWASEGTAGVVKSSDNGASWSDPVGVGIVSTPTPRSSPVELPDGRIAELSGESVIVSDDAGETWTPVSPELPFVPTGFFYSTHQRAFFVYHITCGVGTDAVPANGIMRFDFDYEAQ